MKTCTKTKGGGNMHCGQCPNDVNICTDFKNGDCKFYQEIYTLKDIENAINETIRLKFDANTKIANFVNFGSENSWLSNDEIKSEVLKIYIK